MLPFGLFVHSFVVHISKTGELVSEGVSLAQREREGGRASLAVGAKLIARDSSLESICS